MRAIYITPETQTVEEVQIAGVEEIPTLIGFDTIETDRVDDDVLYFDEECFIRGDAVKGRFQIDSLIPIAGKAVITGADGSDAGITVEELKGRIKFL